jgi:hypothetical protein
MKRWGEINIDAAKGADVSVRQETKEKERSTPVVAGIWLF